MITLTNILLIAILVLLIVIVVGLFSILDKAKELLITIIKNLPRGDI